MDGKYCYISGLLQPELYTTFLASIMFFHSIAKAQQHREQGKHISTIIGGIYLLSLQLDSIQLRGIILFDKSSIFVLKMNTRILVSCMAL
jgi:hypothetical protein